MVNEGFMLRCGCDVFAPRVASRQQAAGRARWGPRKKKARSSSDRACQISWLLGRLSGAAVAGSAVPGLRPGLNSGQVLYHCMQLRGPWCALLCAAVCRMRSEEHTSELQLLLRISDACHCVQKTHNRIDNHA